MRKNVLIGNPVVILDNTSVFAKKERQEKIARKRVCYLYSLDLITRSKSKRDVLKRNFWNK